MGITARIRVIMSSNSYGWFCHPLESGIMMGEADISAQLYYSPPLQALGIWREAFVSGVDRRAWWCGVVWCFAVLGGKGPRRKGGEQGSGLWNSNEI